MFPKVPDHHPRFCLLEERHHFAMTGDIEFHILELPKFTKTLDQFPSRSRGVTDVDTNRNRTRAL
jgi:hypothetical protein